MSIEIIGPIDRIETIAVARGIRERARLTRAYGRGRWRKRKGFGRVRIDSAITVLAEIHWYEATGIGRREFKIKRILNR